MLMQPTELQTSLCACTVCSGATLSVSLRTCTVCSGQLLCQLLPQVRFSGLLPKRVAPNMTLRECSQI
ncbi:hypothetical protein DPMN_164521 [Dreissena polymorpha]|uniref:Uncharacterized protein n=1 Tax=Dreissena polymorpha TaxID=45954 RepID=A0A9D4ET38_DREPO|nr:hypothetical protein DPMN_164521 [Dreissena polymorpha]